jgi:LPS export ABC transporter permease LptG/LPS export ABC transporter permease LptF
MNQILLLSEMFIARGVALKSVLALLIYLIPSILAFTVPMSVLMGILAGLSRMSSDAEITALKTLGISNKRLLRPVLLFSFFGWLVTSLLTLYLAPRANYSWVQTLSQSVLTKVQLRISPREFNESIPNTVIFIQDIDTEKVWRNVFVHFSAQEGEPRVIYAKKGRLNFYAGEKRATLELFEGASHFYSRANPEKYSVTAFERLEEELDIEDLFASFSDKKGVREKDIRELLYDARIVKEELIEIPEAERQTAIFWHKKREHIVHWVEIHKKFALPFACIIFALLGISLGAYTRKGGRTSGFTISIAIIIIYYILITAGENLAVDSRIAPWMGMWGPNILLTLGGLYFFIKSYKEFTLFSSFLWLLNKVKRVSAATGVKRFSFNWPRFSLWFPNILDRYVIRKYIAIFTLVFISLLAIFVIITFFERIDNVYEHNKPLSLFLEFIWSKIPEFIHVVLPVTALTSALLSLGLLTKFNEITAMKACGISLYRIILPVIFLAGVVSFSSFYLQENILPYSNKKAEEIWNRINDLPPRSYSHVDRRWVIGKDQNRIFHYRYFDPIATGFSQLAIYDINPDSWKLKKRTYADKGFLKNKTLSLVNCWVRDFEGDLPISYAREEKMNLILAEDKTYFLKEWKEPVQMSYAELKRYIYRIKERGFNTVRFEVDLYHKISFPLSSLIMVIIGIPFAFSMGKRGTLVGLGLSVLIAMVYWATIAIFRGLGYASFLDAFLAAWGPNLIFGLVGLYLLFTLRT